ncbi:type II secretion system F family protein [uncultured Phascolarctobacterium sp.]|uniref:type II secretion system F family protein n=1 Tax=Phascolarctobacterium sp. TaxID=2049039 RepID=UPI0026002E47|nr:type II secretion system F family protein [uncultured Phascolarctobacterium sp.]
MQSYRWRARSKSGKLYQGSYLADSKQEVASFLRENYGYATGIEEQRPLADKLGCWLGSGRVSDKERSRFFQQLAKMLDSGIPLCRALDLLRNRCARSLTTVCCALISELQAGKSLAVAMKKQPQVFTAVAVAVAEAGEHGGVLQEMLSELAAYYGQKAETASFLKNICLYPCFVLVLSLATFILFIIKLLPLFADLYQSFDIPLATSLRVMLLLRQGAAEYWYALLALIAVMVWYLWQRRLYLAGWFWRLPGVAAYRQLFLEIRFCKILALLLYSGIPLPLAIQSSAAGLGDEKLYRKATTLADAVVRGSDITKAAALATPLLSPVTLEFLTVGESSGSLAAMLKEASLLLEQELTTKLSGLKALFEPVLLVVIALIVGAMIFTVAEPLLTLLTELPEYE